MKKLFMTLMSICFLVLCSCSSLMSELTDTPSYEAQVYSVQYTNEPVSKNDKVLVLCDTGDFMFQRELETEIVAAFSESGIEVVAYSNVEIEAQPPFIEYIYAVALENDCRYVYIVSISEAYSYDYGGGISRINFDSTMADLDMTGIPLRITGAITCKENIFHSYIESLEPACKCMVEAIVNEYMKKIVFCTVDIKS